jgi:hypothetical protein
MNQVKSVGIGKELRPEGFKNGYYNLPHIKMKEVKKQICTACYWSDGNFRLKLSGKTPFRIYEIDQINEIFSKYNLNAWTGEQINGKSINNN